MTISFESDSEVIIYCLEKIIAFSQSQGYICAAQCVWWLASIIGLELGLIIHIDNLRARESVSLRTTASVVPREDIVSRVEHFPSQVHPGRIQNVARERQVSSTPRDLCDDQRVNPNSRAREAWGIEPPGKEEQSLKASD